MLRNFEKRKKNLKHMKLFIKSLSDYNEGEILKVLGNELKCRRSSAHVVCHKGKQMSQAFRTSVNTYPYR